MKNLSIFLISIFCFLSSSCSDNDNEKDEPKIKHNFFLKIYCKDYKEKNGDYQDIPVAVHIFKNNATFPTAHDIKNLNNTYNIYDTDGNKHHALYSYGFDDSLINIDVEPGSYYVIALMKETGRYSVKNITITESSKFEGILIFSSATPDNSFEEWN